MTSPKTAPPPLPQEKKVLEEDLQRFPVFFLLWQNKKKRILGGGGEKGPNGLFPFDDVTGRGKEEKGKKERRQKKVGDTPSSSFPVKYSTNSFAFLAGMAICDPASIQRGGGGARGMVWGPISQNVLWNAAAY